ncbi:MAG: DUF1127 domain-containing protein [Rhodospirillaceae bacterium]|nr:DUF1127 domain-containing protein [Rhodospirillaceae bacterium]
MEQFECIDAAERRYRHHAATTLSQALHGLWEAPAAVGTWVWYCLLVWQHRANARHALRSITDTQLQDMGISRAQAQREASKPIWRA